MSQLTIIQSTAEQLEMPLNDPKGTLRSYVIASSSKANCVAIWSPSGGILVDCGLSSSTTINHLHTLGLNPMDLKAILLTHEHSDHSKGIVGMMRVLDKCSLVAQPALLERYGMMAGKDKRCAKPPVEVDGFQIRSFPVPHDAIDPVGFTIGCGAIAQVGYVTDLGYITTHIFNQLKGVQLLFIESNYDQRMLEASNRHDNLKARIHGGHGHLCNSDCAMLIGSLAKHGLRKAVLCHISDVANTQELAYITSASRCPGVEVMLAKYGLLTYI